MTGRGEDLKKAIVAGQRRVYVCVTFPRTVCFVFVRLLDMRTAGLWTWAVGLWFVALRCNASNATLEDELEFFRRKRACPRIVRVERRPYGEWSLWSACSKSCGGVGVQYRRRQCVVPDCQTSESRPCGNYPCALSWSEWCEWGHCRASCGQGERMRIRYCEAGTLRCAGKDYEVARCHAGVDCAGWTDWSDWTACSASCGLGRQRRERQCRAPHRCHGEPVEHRDCNQICQGEWGAWSGWSACDRPCDAGITHRRRQCLSANVRCSGADLERRRCNDQPCDPADGHKHLLQLQHREREAQRRRLQQHAACRWSGWSAWSECAPPSGYRCDSPPPRGVGVRERQRACGGVAHLAECRSRCAGDPLERQSCRLDPRRDPCRQQ